MVFERRNIKAAEIMPRTRKIFDEIFTRYLILFFSSLALCIGMNLKSPSDKPNEATEIKSPMITSANEKRPYISAPKYLATIIL